MHQDKHLQIVVILLAVLTLTFTAAGTILTIWGVDSLAKLDEQIQEKTDKLLENEKKKFNTFSKVIPAHLQQNSLWNIGL